MIVCIDNIMEPYNPKDIEGKWQKAWAEAKLYETDIHSNKKKIYVLDMFPYPSGEGLHVGHPKGYIATDIYSRMKKMHGYEVLHPMGWDAFGLPAEQFALKNKVHPRIAVEKNIARFKEQLSIIGFNYDWTKEINTTDPEFYKWTQWIFKQMWKKGLAYESHEPINWCPSCKTGLANEDLDGDVCERCGTKVEKRPLRQWVLKITAYADRMIEDLGKLEWPEGIKLAQKNWIGKSEGSQIKFNLCVTGVPDGTYSVDVFTTRADTLMGATFVAISAELAKKWMGMGWKPNEKVVSFIEKTLEDEKNRTVDFKTELLKEGISTEVDAIHPITKEKIPVYVANYVLPGYGTGALMGVPAHDERDHGFALAYHLPIKEVVRPYVIDHVNVPREDKPTKVRRNVHAIVHDQKAKKYLIIRNSIHRWDTVVIGGVEEGEDLVEAAKRELAEETGYTDVIYKRTLGFPVQAGYFAPHKDENRLAIASAVYFELGSHERMEIPTDGENEGNEILWIDESEFVPGKMINSELPYWLTRLRDGKEVHEGGGILVNSGEYDGLTSEEAKRKLTEAAGGAPISQYKLKDWVFARQRYWGEPFPMVFDENHTAFAVADSELPVRLPEVEAYEPTGTGESPLAGIDSWVNVTGYLNDDGDFVSCADSDPRARKFKRETNTMPQWAGSSWYYLRFADPKNDNSLINADTEKKWQPVDVYVGGDHATRHLIYARFWHKFLYDIGVVSYDEPFSRLEFLGFILAEDGRKMSKRLGNVINPDDIVKQYGADALRVYEMFMAPFEQTVAWDTKSIVGVERFLERVWKLHSRVKGDTGDSEEMRTVLHKTIKKVGDDIEGFKFNTAISAMMICLNKAEAESSVSRYWYLEVLKLLAPFAPHMSEELWHSLGEEGFVHEASWPIYDEQYLHESTATIAVQIGGKLRGTLVVGRNLAEMEVLDEVKKTDFYQKYAGRDIPKKVIFVPNKLINIVI